MLSGCVFLFIKTLATTLFKKNGATFGERRGYRIRERGKSCPASLSSPFFFQCCRTCYAHLHSNPVHSTTAACTRATRHTCRPCTWMVLLEQKIGSQREQWKGCSTLKRMKRYGSLWQLLQHACPRCCQTRHTAVLSHLKSTYTLLFFVGQVLSSFFYIRIYSSLFWLLSKLSLLPSCRTASGHRRVPFNRAECRCGKLQGLHRSSWRI